MILKLQVTTKNKYTLELKNKTHLLLLIKLHMKKPILPKINQSPPLHKNPHLQLTYKQILNLLHIVHK